MTKKTRGVSSVGLIGGLVVLALLVFGGLYFFSDVFRTKVDEEFRQFSEWTPENIAENPVLYLNFAEKQTKEAITKLKASEISIAQSEGRLQNKLAESESKVKLGAKALGELRPAYKSARDADAWPIEWNGKKLDMAAAKRQIVSFHKQVKGKQAIVDTITKALKTLQTQKGRILEHRAQLDGQLAEIDSKREMLKVKEITGEITNQLVNMNGVLKSTIAAVGSDTDITTLEDLAETSESSIEDSEFEAILEGE